STGSTTAPVLLNTITTAAVPTMPTLTSGGTALRLAWVNTPLIGQPTSMFSMRFNGTQFVEELPGEAQGVGVSLTGGHTSPLALATDSSGRTTLVWQDTASGHAQIYARGMTATISGTQTYVAAAGTSIQSILNSQSFGPGSVIIVQGAHTENLTLSAANAG